MNANRFLKNREPGNWWARILDSHNQQRLAKLALAVSDQLLFSGSNFVVSVLLGRWMLSNNYGAFTYAYSILLLLASFHNALLLEPFTILGSAEYRHSLKTYTQRIARLQLHWTVVVSGLSLPVGAIVWLAGNRALGEALLGLALAQGAILYFWYVRRKWYVVQRIGHAVIGTTVYAGVQIVAVYALHRASVLTPFSALAAIGVAGAIAGVIGQIAQLEDEQEPAPIRLAQVVRENWAYGKWVMLAGVLFWLTNQSYNILTGSLLGLTDTGGLKAMQNLINPVTQLLTAFNLVFLPWVTRRHAERGERVLYRDLILYTILSSGCAAVYWLALSLFGMPIFDLLYDGRYGEYVHLLPYLALLPVITALTASWTIGLRVLRQTQLLFWVDSAGAAFTITIGVLLVAQFGLSGAIAGTVISSASRVPVLVYLWRRAPKTGNHDPEVAKQ
ncbi:MAG: lipopolysaccharide biosynthesis protein [Chloroflexi bacterium]|nr:lipopolysaccharide biosynthesis protein [Chloroflexota bacterium]